MKSITFPKNLIFSSILFLAILFALTSCSSSKQGYVSDDGIYGSDTGQEVVMVRDSRADYYKQYFEGERELSEQIFTDIDAYKGYDDKDTVYVEEEYYGGNPPWEYSDTKVTVNFNMGFGGYYGWGYPYYGWGWSYPYYGWGYPGYGWGYPGWGWGYYPPYHHYPPYYGSYTYGKRYAYNTGRFNTRNLYTENSISSSYRRSSSEYNRSSISNYEPRRSSSASGERSYRSSSRARSSGYDSGNRTAPSYNNKSYNNSRSYSRPSSPSMGRSSSGYRGSSGSMRGSSSGRRSMSYIQLQERENASNRVFVKQGTRKTTESSTERVSYSQLRETPQFSRIQNSEGTKYAPSTRYSKSSSTSSGNRSVRSSGNSGNTSSYSRSSASSSKPSGVASPSRPASRASSSSRPSRNN